MNKENEFNLKVNSIKKVVTRRLSFYEKQKKE